MRKPVRAALAACLCLAVALVCAGCSQAESVEGRWTLINVYDADGNEMAGTSVENEFGLVVVYDFQADGTLVTSLGDATVEGTWTQDGAEVTITLEGQDGEGKIEGDTLTLEYGGGVSEFERS